MNTKSFKKITLLLIIITVGLPLTGECNPVKSFFTNTKKLELAPTEDSALDARLASINDLFWTSKTDDVDGSRDVMKKVLENHKESKAKAKKEARAIADQTQGMTKEEAKEHRKKVMKESEAVELSEENKQMFTDGKAQFVRGWKAVSAQSTAVSRILEERDQAIDNALGLRKPDYPSYGFKKEQRKRASDEYEAAMKRYRDQRSKGLRENSAAKRIQEKYAPASSLSNAIFKEVTMMTPTAFRIIRFGLANKIDVSDLQKLTSKSDKEVEKMNKRNRAGDDEEE